MKTGPGMWSFFYCEIDAKYVLNEAAMSSVEFLTIEFCTLLLFLQKRI